MSTSPSPYILRISRLTIDKLGVKLYDKVSAVVAELVANGYDADANNVTIRLPLSSLLASKNENGVVEDGGFLIEVEDDGHGMTPDEVNAYYLEVGRDRRRASQTGGLSRNGRQVMGRKGIGKLAPFGICKRMEVWSAGGPHTDKGYLVSHFFLDYDKIVCDDNESAELERGEQDRTYAPESKTIVRLASFLPRRVPDSETFHRQLAARFIISDPNFQIHIEDVRDPENNPPQTVKPISVPTQSGTRIDLSNRPVTLDDGTELPVKGWIAMARESYKNEEFSGVRIYARDKIVATTRDFNQPAGFTGEFTIRSYLVGEVFADWLDLDEGEDLIRTDRQDILWDSDYGRALRSWGSELIKEIGASSAAPRREQKKRAFLDKSKFEERARTRYANEDVINVAVELAGKIGAFAAEDEIEDDDYVNGLAEVVLSVAPHKALIDAFQEFSREAVGGDVDIDKLVDLFGKTRVAELASYSQIAAERVQAIQELERIVIGQNVNEREFQKLIERAPWLIEPTWSVITKNQSLKTFQAAFQQFWKSRTGEDLVLSIGYSSKQPDFILVNVGQKLHIVEIKPAGHTFNDNDCKRLLNYVDAFETFFGNNPGLCSDFPQGWRITLVVDSAKVTEVPNKRAFDASRNAEQVQTVTWVDFLDRAKRAHELFLQVSDKFDESHAVEDGVAE